MLRKNKILVSLIALTMLFNIVGVAAAEQGQVDLVPEVSLKLNNEYCQETIIMQNGISCVSLGFIKKAVPVDIVTDGGKITIAMNEDKLELEVNSNAATLNGMRFDMPISPKTYKQDTIVPLRLVLECFSGKVGWNGAAGEILVTSPTLKDGLTAKQMSAKTQQAMSAQGRYKMKMDIMTNSEAKNNGIINGKAIVTAKATAAIQENPLLGHMVIEMKSEEEGTPVEILKSEMVINNDSVFTTMPDYEGWIDVGILGISSESLLGQFGVQDPTSMFAQLERFAADVSYGSDLIKDGKRYGVINIAIEDLNLAKYTDLIAQQLGLFGVMDSDEINTFLKEVLQNFKIAVYSKTIFDYGTFLPTDMDMTMNMALTLNVPKDTEDSVSESEMQMKLNQAMNCQFYDYGVKFTVPDVSGAKNLQSTMVDML